MHDIFEAEAVKFPELRTAYHRHTARRDDERIARRRLEWRSATVIIVASNFTRASYARAGLDTGRVRVIPLGAPPPIPAEGLRPSATAGRPTFLWAGSFSTRKGALYLLEAWRRGNLGRHARLLVFGAPALPERLLRPLPEGVELRGSIPRSELMEQYQQSDALIFPTLGDGFGMVATEAWSRGLPVITTDCAGAADLLQPGRNGLLIRAASAEAIVESLEWCLDHRPELAAMREGSLATAARWQWSDYRQALAAALRDAGMFSPR
jgi:glycosyltransferase involved in cell wall biosynthesis